VLIDFSGDFSRLKGREFLDLLGKGGMTFLAIGINFRCGYQQEADANLIREINQEKGIPTELVTPVIAGTEQVSSSRIRPAISGGDLSLAAALMGRNVELDLAGLKPSDLRSADIKSVDIESGGLVYEPRSHHRIVPADGQYSVLIKPGAHSAQVYIEGGKIFLPGQAQGSVESLEFV
jgi:riboflavin kinase/FMN adenylyltransferase